MGPKYCTARSSVFLIAITLIGSGANAGTYTVDDLFTADGIFGSPASVATGGQVGGAVPIGQVGNSPPETVHAATWNSPVPVDLTQKIQHCPRATGLRVV